MIHFVAVHLWQSTLFVLAAWALTLLFRKNGADFRFLIWFGAAAKFLVPLALLQWLGERVGQSLPQPLAVDQVLIETANAIFTPSLGESLPGHDVAWSVVQGLVFTIWACGTLLLGLRWWREQQVLKALLATSQPLSMHLPVPVHVTRRALAPGVFGIWRPVVILPESVVHSLDSAQLQAVLAHELCHVQRGDNLLALIQRCVETLFWFHPLVWWVGSKLLCERETACDQAVLEEGHEQQAYAESILSVCRLCVTSRFTGLAASTGGDLTQRVVAIMSAEAARPVDSARFALLLATATLACSAPVFTGIAHGAAQAAASTGPVTFDVLDVQVAAPDARSHQHFDPAGELVLDNVSMRQLIDAAYPWAWVSGDPAVIDAIHYDIHVRWQGNAGINERAAYRELLRRVLQANTNVQLYVDQRCEMGCGRIP